MGPLASVFSTIDSLRRRAKDAVLNPMESLYQGVRNFGSDWGKTLDTQAQAYPSIPRTPEQSMRLAQMVRTPEQARSELADIGANMGIGAATVWHGSPHKFNKFDSSKIGTGEGAQAYGHGLYLAESPDVAKSYQTTLTMDRGFNFGDKSGLTREQLQDLVNAREGGKYLDGVTKPSGVADQVIDAIVYGKNGELPRGYKPGSERAALFERLKKEIAHTDQGALYKVDLPDEHIAKMLDWDKPLSQQAGIKLDVVKNPEAWGQEQWLSQVTIPGQEPRILDAFKTRKQAIEAHSSMTGGDLLRKIDPQIGQANAAKMLRESGIPGIRYLDGGSRGAGTGTSNYVVFPGNEDILKILERNGIPLE